MPQYRFVLSAADDRPRGTEELGLFNDQGALQYASRLGHNRSVEIWQGSRLVGRIDPATAPPVAEPVKTLAS